MSDGSIISIKSPLVQTNTAWTSSHSSLGVDLEGIDMKIYQLKQFERRAQSQAEQFICQAMLQQINHEVKEAQLFVERLKAKGLASLGRPTGPSLPLSLALSKPLYISPADPATSGVQHEFVTKNSELNQCISECLAQCRSIRTAREEREAQEIQLREQELKAEEERIAKAQEAAQARANPPPPVVATPTALPSAPPAVATPAPSTSAPTLQISENARGDYTKYQALIQNMKHNIYPAVKGNRVLSKTAFDTKLRIIPKIGQLTNSRNAILRIAGDIHTAIESVRANGEALYIYMLNITAKGI
ncbi:hypothetical protein BJ085DRAFT_35449, partial [Dimargaris cristalligena]